MSHLEQDALRRILGGTGAPQEAETAEQHIFSCGKCRAFAGSVLEELRAERPGWRGDGSLQLVLDLIDQERKWGGAPGRHGGVGRSAAQAERLFNEVVDRDVEHELYKDAFLDLLYLYGRHVKVGDLGKAARVCQRALTDSSLVEVAHDQLPTLWSQLLEAAQHQAISQDILKVLRQYLSAHWKHPAEKGPSLR